MMILGYSVLKTDPALTFAAADAWCGYGDALLDASLFVVRDGDAVAAGFEIDTEQDGAWDLLALARRGDLAVNAEVTDHGDMTLVTGLRLFRSQYSGAAWPADWSIDALADHHQAWAAHVVLASARWAALTPTPREPRPAGRGDAVEIVIRGEIDHDHNRARDLLPVIRGAGVRSILLDIDTPGGSWDEAEPVYRALLRHPYRVEARMHNALSAGALLSLAADFRAITPAGSIYLHRPLFSGLHRYSDDLRRDADEMYRLADTFASMVAARTPMTFREARDFMAGDGSTFSAVEAVEYGLAHDIDHHMVASAPKAIRARFAPIASAHIGIRPKAFLRPDVFAIGASYRAGQTVMHKGKRYACRRTTIGQAGSEEPGHARCTTWKVA